MATAFLRTSSDAPNSNPAKSDINSPGPPIQVCARLPENLTGADMMGLCSAALGSALKERSVEIMNEVDRLNDDPYLEAPISERAWLASAPDAALKYVCGPRLPTQICIGRPSPHLLAQVACSTSAF